MKNMGVISYNVRIKTQKLKDFFEDDEEVIVEEDEEGED